MSLVAVVVVVFAVVVFVFMTNNVRQFSFFCSAVYFLFFLALFLRSASAHSESTQAETTQKAAQLSLGQSRGRCQLGLARAA